MYCVCARHGQHKGGITKCDICTFNKLVILDVTINKIKDRSFYIRHTACVKTYVEQNRAKR